MLNRILSILPILPLFIAVALAASGCTSEEEAPPPTKNGGDTPGDGEVTVQPVELEPFDPPSLEELESKIEWEDRPVLDGLELLREHQKKLGPPLASVKEALALRNDSAEDNEKIRSAMGQLPKNDGEVNYNGSVIRHTSGDVKSTNPLFMSSSAEFDVLGLTSFGLFSFDWDLQPFAPTDTVVTWQSSKNRMYDKVVMRDDLTWSDGTPITAHDVVFSFQTIMNPDVPVPAVKSGTDQIRWVHAYDDHTIVFFHKEALATNHWNINFPIIPKHIYEDSLADDHTMQNSPYHVKHENNPVTGGPFVITKRTRGQEIVLKRRESWYMHDGKQVRKKPFFENIRFKLIEDTNTTLLAIKAGEIDECILSAEQWDAQTNDAEFYKRNTKARGLEWTSFHFIWNVKSPFFDDLRVRKAMSYAFDHKEMLDKLFYGLYEPSNGTFHHTSWMAPKDPPKPYTQDLDKAEELLDAAGWDDSDLDGVRDKEINGRLVPFEFTIVCSQTPNSIKICALLKESLDRIGIICNVKPTEFTVLQDLMLKHNFHAGFGGWGTGTDPDTSENIWTTKAIDQGRNYGQYSNERVDELFELGKREFDQEKRAEIYGEIHKILYEDQPYTWLFYRDAFYAFNKKLRGYNFSPRGPYTYSPGFDSIWTPAK